MFILRAIGSFFARIGRWIKNTAWVQPLLIVGGIFAIIFSIPYISRWVSSWFQGGDTAGTKYYAAHEVSLDGAQDKDGLKSNANKLFNYMKDYDTKKETESARWGDKFFVVFVQKDCLACEDMYQAFESLEDGWGKGEFVKPASVANEQQFKLYTVFIDTEATINNEKKNLFKDYFFNDFGDAFEDLNAVMQDSPYKKNTGGSSYVEDLASLSNSDDFKSPTIMLFDPNYTEGVMSQLGVNEVLFSVPGKNGASGAFPMARTLYDCWYHLDVFNVNPPQN